MKQKCRQPLIRPNLFGNRVPLVSMSSKQQIDRLEKEPEKKRREYVVNGWPGIKGKVYLDEPVQNRWGEWIVIYRSESGFLNSRNANIGEIAKYIK